MNSANGHHQNHRLQDQAQRVSASLAAPSSYGTGGNHEWPPNIMDAGNSNNFLIQDDLGHLWDDDSGSGSRLMNKSTSEFLNSTPPSIIDYPFPGTGSDMRSGHKGLNTDVSEKMLFESLASGHQVCSNAQNYGSFANAGMPSRGTFSQIYPSVNISNQLDPSFPAMPMSLDMNLQALDLFNPTRFTGSTLSHPSQDELGNCRDQMQHRTSEAPCGDPNSTNGIMDAKRTSILLEPKGSSSPTATAKKSRLGSRASCTPFKVRKEKLGDRVAALQQLVAPFGKTDTASVLMEAIGYIKFLQNQVETLSVPYMKSSGNRKGKALQGGSTIELEDHHQTKRDLRSQGLCLVPMSCMSYITGDNNNANFGAGTF